MAQRSVEKSGKKSCSVGVAISGARSVCNLRRNMQISAPGYRKLCERCLAGTPINNDSAASANANQRFEGDDGAVTRAVASNFVGNVTSSTLGFARKTGLELDKKCCTMRLFVIPHRATSKVRGEDTNTTLS
jgi:hypothetical protein